MITSITYMLVDAMHWLIVASCYLTAAIGYQWSAEQADIIIVIVSMNKRHRSLSSSRTANVPCYLDRYRYRCQPRNRYR